MLTWWLPGCITAYFVELNEKHKDMVCQTDRLSAFNPIEIVKVRFSKSLSSIIIVLFPSLLVWTNHIAFDKSCADPETFVRGGPTLKTFF